MAINLNCNLNGGDTVTPNNELFYRIYGDVDAYTSPIHTTGTAIADADVTVTGDVVDILNVDGTTNTEFKIAAVDGAGNEGILSDAHSGSIIIYEEHFDGVTFDPLKWTVSDTSAHGSVTQNNEAIFTNEGTGNVLTGEERITGVDLQPIGVCYAFDVEVSNQTTTTGFLVLFNDFDGGTEQFGITNLTAPSATLFNLVRKFGGVTDEEEVTLDLSTAKTIKFHFTGTACNVYYWDGSWVSFGASVAGGNVAKQAKVYSGITSSQASVMTLDNIYITNADYATQYPI